MQQWEYMRLYYYPLDGTFQANGRDQRDWNGQSVDNILNGLGGQGWELVSAVGNVNHDRTGPATTSYYFFFKRPKE